MKRNECDLKAMAVEEEIKGDKWKISASKCVADPWFRIMTFMGFADIKAERQRRKNEFFTVAVVEVLNNSVILTYCVCYDTKIQLNRQKRIVIFMAIWLNLKVFYDF